jgi:poly(A) polymerase
MTTVEHDPHLESGKGTNTIMPLIIPRSEHPISRSMMSEEALKVLHRLHYHGFLSYLVGGSVRDLLLGKTPKDFDVVTNAHPHQIKEIFRNSRTIGRRFRLIHVFFRGPKIIEVSTFRSRSEYEETETEDGRVIRTESFGTPEEDAFRRDITINGLFYNIADFCLIDYVGGMQDLRHKIIQTIGDPNERFKQDPVRMIRVIRHAARTGFSIEDRTWQAVAAHCHEIRKCSPSRVRDEFLRDLKEGASRPSLHLMLKTGLLFSIFPDLNRVFGSRNPFQERDQQFFLALFSLIDQLAQSGQTVSDAMLYALFLSPFLRTVTPVHPFLGEKEQFIYEVQTLRWALQQVYQPFSLPRGIKETVFQILMAQTVLRKTVSRGVFPGRLRTKKYFLEAALFYGIEAEARKERVPRVLRNGVPSDLLPWWPQGEINERRRRSRRRHRPTSSAAREGT